MADTIEYDSKHRVAFDLANNIRVAEDKDWNREYILTLYEQCYSVVTGGSAQRALEKGK